MEIILYIIIFIVISGLIMVGTNILYDIATAIVPITAIVIIAVGILVGFIVAIKNTFSVYKEVYVKKGKQQ